MVKQHSYWQLFSAVFSKDLKLAFRQRAEIVNPILFFLNGQTMKIEYALICFNLLLCGLKNTSASNRFNIIRHQHHINSPWEKMISKNKITALTSKGRISYKMLYHFVIVKC